MFLLIDLLLRLTKWGERRRRRKSKNTLCSYSPFILSPIHLPFTIHLVTHPPPIHHSSCHPSTSHSPFILSPIHLPFTIHLVTHSPPIHHSSCHPFTSHSPFILSPIHLPFSIHLVTHPPPIHHSSCHPFTTHSPCTTTLTDEESWSGWCSRGRRRRQGSCKNNNCKGSRTGELFWCSVSWCLQHNHHNLAP